MINSAQKDGDSKCLNTKEFLCNTSIMGVRDRRQYWRLSQ